MDKSRNIRTFLILCSFLPTLTEQNKVNVNGKVIVGDHMRRLFNDVWNRIVTQYNFKASSVDSDQRYNYSNDAINRMKSFEEMPHDEISLTDDMDNNKQLYNKAKVKSDSSYLDFNSILNMLNVFFENKASEKKSNKISSVKNYQPTILVKSPNKEKKGTDFELLGDADKVNKADVNLNSFDDEITVNDIGNIKFNIEIDASDEALANLITIGNELRAKSNISSNKTESSYETKAPAKHQKRKDDMPISPISVNNKEMPSVHKKGHRKKKTSTSTMRNWNNIKI